jgi:hypothetical protein
MTAERFHMQEVRVSQLIPMVANFVAIFILIFGVYFPRHRRRDMIVAYLAINTGVLAIAAVLSSVDTSVGLGVGLFGVLSIIRLRSAELGGTRVDATWMTLGLMGVIVAALWFGDNPRLLGRYHTRLITLDRAFVDEGQLIAYLGGLLGAEVRQVAVHQIDLVNDTTRVEVRYELPAIPASKQETLDARPAAGTAWS